MCSFSANIFSFDRHRDHPFPPICLSHRPCITKKDTAYTFRSSALVGSGKTLGPNKEKQPVPFSGYKPPFDLLSGAKTNLPDSLKPNNTSTSCLQYVFCGNRLRLHPRAKPRCRRSAAPIQNRMVSGSKDSNFFSLPPYHRVGIAKMQQDIPQTASFPLNSNHAKRISLKKTLCIKLSE